MPYALHHADSGSEDDEAPLVGGDGRSINASGGARSAFSSSGASSFTSRTVVGVTNALNRIDKLPICCCKLTPFNVLVFLLIAVGSALLIPGVLMRLESVPSPSPLVLLNLCRQPTTFASSALDSFRNQVSEQGSDEAGEELKYQGISVSTSALSVYRGSDSYHCSDERAFAGSSQVIPLPDTLLYTGVTYVTFLTLPLYVVGGSISMRLYSSEGLLFNVTTSLHLHRYLSLHEIVWLQQSHAADTFTRVYNPHLPPAPVHAHGVREEECRLENGCSYRVRAGMQSLILTSTAFRIPTPEIDPLREAEEERAREMREMERARAELHGEVDPNEHPAEPAKRRTFKQDESMLLYASNLTLVIDYAQVIESNALAEAAEAHVPGESETYLYDGSASSAKKRTGPMEFISPDILLSFHQYELSPMQHVGVSYIIRGSILLLAAIAIAYVRWVEVSQREKPKHP